MRSKLVHVLLLTFFMEPWMTITSSSETKQLNVESLLLHFPPLEDLATVLQTGLEKSFAKVSVSVIDSTDLTKAPFYLAAEGISGKTAIADIGASEYLLPVPQKDKIYSFDAVAQAINYPGAFMLGAGIGPFHVVGNSTEYVANIKLGRNAQEDIQKSYVIKYNPTTQNYETIQMSSSNDFAFLMNVFVSEGKPGKVLKIVASKRTGKSTFINTMRESVRDHYGNDRIVAIGGAFVVMQGVATLLMQPGFSSVPLATKEDVMKWLLFFNMTSPLTCPSVFVSGKTKLEAKLEHVHCFSQHGQGGHYVNDVTPDDVEYLGYFTAAEKFYRVDRPNAKSENSSTWNQAPVVGPHS